jgi:RND family efflux transporter MFP subunit
MKHDIASSAPDNNVRSRLYSPWLFVVVGGVLALFVAYSFIHRADNEKNLANWTRERAIQNVAVVEPHTDPHPEVFSLPGKISAWYEASIYAQISGYIQIWKTDIGAIVKKGELLAIVDTPELDDQLARANEELNRAQAGLELAKVTAERWAALRQSSAVSKQSADEKSSDAQVKLADLGAAQANLDRLKSQKAFAQIVAPFDGVVTARNIDIGSYVSPSHNAKPLFKVADIHAVRLYVDVPQIYSARMATGMKATFTTPQWGDRKFDAKISTTSNAIGEGTGSLLVELDTPNPDGALFPGSYADVHFELPADPNQLRIPASALLFDEHGARVATVDDKNRVKFKPVVIAKDLGAEIVLASGVAPHDRIIDDPPETLMDGDEVRIQEDSRTGAKG